MCDEPKDASESSKNKAERIRAMEDIVKYLERKLCLQIEETITDIMCEALACGIDISQLENKSS